MFFERGKGFFGGFILVVHGSKVFLLFLVVVVVVVVLVVVVVVLGVVAVIVGFADAVFLW